MRKYAFILIFILFITINVNTKPNDSNDYIPATLKYLKITFPIDLNSLKSGNNKIALNIDARLPHLKMVLKYEGKIRSIPGKQLKLINSLCKMSPRFNNFNDAKYELYVSENNNKFWIPFPNNILDTLKTKLKEHEEFTAYIIYVGYPYQSTNDRILVLNDFTTVINKPMPMFIFSNTMLGIKLGSDLQKTLSVLRSKYGKSIQTIVTDYMQNVTVFQIDKNTNTVLFVFDGGPEYRNHVHSLQLTGYNNSNFVFYNNLSLGISKKELLTQIKTKYSTQKLSDGIHLIVLDNSGCSFRIKNDKLYSVLISDDIYY